MASKFTPRLPKRGTVFRTLSIAVVVLGIGFLATAGYVYYQAVKTFEIRRVSLPTRIYADLQPVRPGVSLGKKEMTAKLRRLGYRNVEQVGKPGEYVDAEEMTIWLRGFRHPSGDREPERISVAFDKGAISAVQSIDRGGPAETAALEPELLTSVLSEQLENRRPVSLDQVPPHLVDAIVVTEDVRFWQHPGVDPIGIFRALFRNLKAGGVAEGGSTLTQQLVKNYYLTSERTLRRKVVEAFMSVILDAKYSKREILEAYINDIYLGRNRSISILGVGEAARFYFGKPVSEIDHAEAALIAGIIRSPNNYSPFEFPERAQKRRKTVLDLMKKNEKISDEEYAKAVEKDLPEKPYEERSGLESIPFYVDLVQRELSRDYGIEEIRGAGLNIYTAIDLEWQDAAATTLREGLERLEKRSSRLRRKDAPLQGVMMGVDIESGEIRALVGGRDYDESQFNRALLAKRQVGSLFKPFVFLAAFEPSLSNQNITPATRVNDSRFVLERRFSADWSPKNYGNDYRGETTVWTTLVHSLNAASVRIGLSTGIPAIIKAARALGIESDLENNPSLILGAEEITPIEMAEAYTTLGRMGNRIPLRSVRYVADDDGKVIASGVEAESVQVFPARAAYLTVSVMEGVVDRGTAASARSLGFRKTAAGKTGTTNDKRDAWFIGFTPKRLALTWIGFDDNKPTGLSGSDGAVPIWTRFMKEITAADPDVDFPMPSGIVFAPVDRNSGGLATLYCPEKDVINMPFKTGTAPAIPCPLHQAELPPVEPMLGLDGQPIDPSTVTGGFDPNVLPERGPGLDPNPLPPPVTQPPASTQPAPQPGPPPTRTLPTEPRQRPESPPATRTQPENRPTEERRPPQQQNPQPQPPREDPPSEPNRAADPDGIAAYGMTIGLTNVWSVEMLSTYEVQA